MPKTNLHKSWRELRAKARALERGGPMTPESRMLRQEAASAKDALTEQAVGRLAKRGGRPLLGRVAKGLGLIADKSVVLELVSPQRLIEAAQGVGKKGRRPRA